MVRALTNDELTLLRSENQTSRLYLALPQPAVVFQARINQDFSSLDTVLEINYYDVTYGNYTKILPDMTLLIGTAPGAYDIGTTRIRASATPTKLYIAETSEIKFSRNQYLTVIASWEPWPRHIRIGQDKRSRIDSTILYSDQHKNFDPVPVFGPHRVAKLSNGQVTLNFDASNSWVIDSAITQYSYSAPGASSTSGMNTATPTITYNMPGTYYVSCTVTAANGKSFTGYRMVYIYDDEHMPITQFRLNRCSGKISQGGWEATVTLYDEASLTQVRDRSLAIIFADDYYGGTKTSIGPVVGSEHIVLVGWVSTEDLVYSPEEKTLTFTIAGLARWLDKMPGFPVGIEDTNFGNNGGGDPDRWTEIKNLTVDKGAWHLLHWRTTATRCADIMLSGDLKQTPSVESSVGSLWGQLRSMYETQLLANVATDRYSRLYAFIDAQLLPLNDRNTIPVVMDIQKNDWTDSIEIERRVISEVSMVELSGIAYAGGKAKPYFSRAPGSVFKRFGTVEVKDRLLLSSQAQANELAGLLLGSLNNEYPNIVIHLSSNQRMTDIAPAQYVSLSVSENDTVRGIVWIARRLIPREVIYAWEERGGYMLTTLICEAETYPENSITITRPQTPAPNFPPPMNYPPEYWPLPPIAPPGGWHLPPPEWIPPGADIPTDPSCRYDHNYPENGPYTIYSGQRILTNTDAWPLRIPIHLTLRSPSAVYPSRYVIAGAFQARHIGGSLGPWVDTLDDAFYNVYAIDLNGNRVATGVHDPVVGDGSVRTGTFSNVAAVDISAIEIELVNPYPPPVSVGLNWGSLVGPPNEHYEMWYMNGNHLIVFGSAWQRRNDWYWPEIEFFIRPNKLVDGDGNWFAGFNSWKYWGLAVTYNCQFWYLEQYEFFVQTFFRTEESNNTKGITLGPFGIGANATLNVGARTHSAVPPPGYKQLSVWHKFEFWKEPTRRLILSSLSLYNICTWV